MDFFVLECECDGVSMSAKRCDESDSVVLGDSSIRPPLPLLGDLAPMILRFDTFCDEIHHPRLGHLPVVRVSL